MKVYGKYHWLSLIFCLLGLSIFVSFNHWVTKDFLLHSSHGSSKSALFDLIIYAIVQYPIGYWIVRIFVLFISLYFGYDFIHRIIKKKKRK